MSSQQTTDTPTQNTQIILLTAVLALLFVIGMGTAGYEWLSQGKAIAQAPFESGWGLILVSIGALLRDLAARAL